MSRSEWDDDFDDLDGDDLEDWDDDADDDVSEYAHAVSARPHKRRGCLWWCFVGWWWVPVKWVFIGLAYLYFILPYRLIKWMVKTAVQLVRGVKDKYFSDG